MRIPPLLLVLGATLVVTGCGDAQPESGDQADDDPRATGVEATAPPSVDVNALSPMVATDWSGSLTYIDYNSGAETEIAAALQVQRVAPDTFSVAFIYPDEPQANDTSLLVVEADGARFGGRPVLAAGREGDAYVITTSERGVDGGEEVVRFFTYRISDGALRIRTDYQPVGTEERRLRNEFRFTHDGDATRSAGPERQMEPR